MTEEIDQGRVQELIDEIGIGSLISLGGIGAEKFLSILFVFSVTNIGGAALYGVIAVLQNLLGFFGFFTGGPLIAAERTISRLEKAGQNGVFLIATVLSLAFNLVIGVSILVFDNLVFANTVISVDQSEVLLLFLGSLLVSSLSASATNYLKANRRIRLYNWFRKVIGPLLLFVFALPALFVEATAVSVWLSVTASIAVSALLSILAIWRYADFSFFNLDFEKSTVKRYFSYTGSSTVSTMMTSIQLFGFSMFMAVFLTPLEAGVFGVSLAVGVLSKYFLFSVNQIFPPIASELYSEGGLGEIDRLYKITSKLITLLSVPVAALTISYYPEIMGLFSNSYLQFAYVLPIVALGNFLASIYGSVGYLLMMTDNEKPNAILQTVLTAVSIIVTYFLTTTYGLLGLAVAYTTVFVLNNTFELLTLYKLEGLQPFTFDHLRFLATGFAVVIVALALRQFAPLVVSVLITVSLLWFYLIREFNSLDSIERSVLVKLYNKVKSVI